LDIFFNISSVDKSVMLKKQKIWQNIFSCTVCLVIKLFYNWKLKIW